ncbi:hypothetical protein [Tumidithrix helvetica]|uniref:hypothetical protein n=1 Tax=Tumidithrix helvetica TaxID=3457545 RepID=UPI003CC5CAA5
MFKLSVCGIGLSTLSLLTACQSTPTSVPPEAIQKAESYLRSQLKLATSVAIATQAQSVQQLSQADLCQTVAPTQTGFEIVLQAESSRYTLHTNQDGSAIELCSSEDAKPDSTNKFSGAGYTLRYPKDWQVQDEGLEASGQNLVRFSSPSSDPNNQSYAIVARIPMDKSDSQSVTALEPAAETPKGLKSTAYDVKSKGGKSGSQLEYTQKIANKSGTSANWRVKVLLINVEKFSYRIYSYKPESDTSPDKTFDLFVDSFTLIK